MPEINKTLAPLDSVNVTIQPYKTETGDPLYLGYLSFLDNNNQEQWVELKATEPLLLINQINDALRYKEVSLGRIAGEIPLFPSDAKDATRKTEKH